MSYDPYNPPTAVPLWRQAEVLKITDEQALEGYFTFVRTRESKAEKYPDFVLARKACSHTLNRLAAMAEKVDEAWVETCLSTMEDRAQEIAEKREQGRAA
jgi:hypothetical protein